jgi:hypothetical protein
MAPFSITTHEFSMKVLRRDRSIQLREMSTIPHIIVSNYLHTVIARSIATWQSPARSVSDCHGFDEASQ